MSAMTDERRSGSVLGSGRTRGSFPAGFKADAVALVLEGGRTIASVARSLGIGESSLGNWVRQARIDCGEREGLTAGERAELARLRRENAQLRMERDLPKRTTAFWVAESGQSGGWLPAGPKGSRPRCAAAWRA